MNPETAISQMLLTESERHPHPVQAQESEREPDSPIPSPTLMDPSKTLAMSLSRIGTPTQRIISGTLTELSKLTEEDFGGPLHSLVVVGKRVHPLELEFAGRFSVDGENGQWWKVGQEVYGVVREGRS